MKQLKHIISKDDLRPDLRKVWFLDDYIYATDSHICLKIHKSMYPLTLLNTKQIGIPKEIVDKLSGDDIRIYDNKVEVIKKQEMKTYTFESNLYHPNNNIVFSIQRVINDAIEDVKEVKKGFNVKNVGIDVELLAKIDNVCKSIEKSRKIYVNQGTENKPLLITMRGYDTDKFIGLIMPQIYAE